MLSVFHGWMLLSHSLEIVVPFCIMLNQLLHTNNPIHATVQTIVRNRSNLRCLKLSLVRSVRGSEPTRLLKKRGQISSQSTRSPRLSYYLSST